MLLCRIFMPAPYPRRTVCAVPYRQTHTAPMKLFEVQQVIPCVSAKGTGLGVAGADSGYWQDKREGVVAQHA